MTQVDASRHYQGESGRRYHEQKRGIPEGAIPWVARLRAEKIAPHIRPTDVVFEYGVGSGWNLAQITCAKKLGFDISDFLEPAVQAAGIEFIRDTKTIASDSVDVCLCHHTLEHVVNPPDVLKESRRVLKPGGQLLLFVPHEREGKYLEFDRNEPNHHLYSWNVQTLGNLVEECGFEVRDYDVGRFGYYRFASVWAMKLHLGENGFRAIRGLLHMFKPAFEIRIVALKKSNQ